MSNFTAAVEYVLLKEGGFVDDPEDHGGVTNFGISARELHKLWSQNESLEYCADYIRKINRDEAIELYQRFWWKPEYDQLTTPTIATYLFDMVVNMGTMEAVKLLQRACWSIARAKNCEDNGILGTNTLRLVNNFGILILPCLRAMRLGYYELLITRDSTQHRFMDGWIARTLSL